MALTILRPAPLVAAGILAAATLTSEGVAQASDRAMAQRTDHASALLSAVAGTDPAACQLILNALDDRWHGGGGRPSAMLSDRTAAGARELAAWTRRVEPDMADVRTFAEGLSAPDTCVRSVSARMLGRVDDRDTTARLIAMAGDSRSPARRAAMVALGYVGSSDALPMLVDALRDADSQVRLTAAVALGQIESSDAIPALTAALASDSDIEVRRAVAWALGKIE